jgi:hypothetical protein
MEINKEITNRLENVMLETYEDLDIIEEICENVNDFNIVPLIFKIFENNPKFDFGSPGNLVHIAEKYYKNDAYITELYKSIEREPMFYNLWMLNRYLNKMDEEQKTMGIMLLKKIVETTEDDVVKGMAKDFLKFQTK